MADPKERILLADDEEYITEALTILLEDSGYQVDAVKNGEEALNKLCHQKYDLLITDIVMPHLNGAELIEKIRLLNPDIPVMVVSGKLNEPLIDELKESGVQYILPKPINPSRFRKTIEKIFRNGNGEPSAG